MKIKFDMKYRPQIESGEYKVFALEHEEQEARIVCWDNKGDYPIIALVDNEPEKFDKHGRIPGGNRGGEFSLFIITPEPELSEFEKGYMRIVHKMNPEDFNDDGLKIAKEEAAELLDLARKEIIDGWSNGLRDTQDRSGKAYSDGYKLGHENGKAEALKEIEQDPESSYAFKRGVEYGKEEALKDLPRWRSFRRNSQDYPFFSNCEDGENCLVFDGKCIKMCELLKLPGFND